ncbi:MAG: MCE family protein [Nitrosomonas sp.]|nr:MCE family protein [Nitrosomonas sp.]
MGKRANPAIIGAFVLGGCILATIAVILLGGDQLYKKKRDFVMYFEGSVNGLNVGAPVSLRGVQVGKVKNISLINDYTKGEIRIPVVAEYYPENVITIGEEFESEKDNVKKLVETFGLRAQLQTQSMLTGQLFIQLDYHPNSSYVYYGDGDVIEVPIIPSTLELFERKFRALDFSSITNDINAVATAISEVATNPKLNQSIDNLEKALKATNQAMLTATNFINDIDSKIVPISNKTHLLLDKVAFTLSKIDTVLVNIEELSNEESPTVYKIHIAMDELTNAAKSIRELTDTLERQPEALLQGKKSGK